MGSIFRSTHNTRAILPGSLRFVRSDVPNCITEEEVKWLVENNITTVIDLREDNERADKKCPLIDNDFFVLYFCNAGKDRTGVVSALLLYKIGMSRDYIVNDYMESKSNLKDMLEAYAVQCPNVDIDVITPHERYICEFISDFERREHFI